MTDTFTKISQDIEGEGSSGVSDEIRVEATRQRNAKAEWLVAGGAKSMESYVDAVGFIRGLDHILNWKANQRHRNQRELKDEKNFTTYDVEA